MRRFAALFALSLYLPAQTQDEPKPPTKVDFEREIAPILVARCIECHGPKEHKGDLRLDAKAHAFPAGAEDAWCVSPSHPDDSELIVRINLPANDEDVMPQKGEPLTAAQRDLLRRWVAEGADWPASGDAWIEKQLAAQVLPKLTFELPVRDAATDAAIARACEALRERGALVQQVAADTPALDVNLSLLRDKATDADLELLEPLAPVLVWLNAGRTAVTDAGLAHVARLSQLRRLDLGNTKVGDGGFAALGSLVHLEYLNAYGTQLGDEGLEKLAALPKLRRLYVWQSKVSAAGAAAARGARAELEIDTGDYVEERLAAAQREIDAREAKNRPVNDVCPVSGEPVDAAQFVDFEGRRIAFCCAKCKAKFEGDPQAFAQKLPKSGETPVNDAPQPINDVCPVSGKPVDAAHFVDFEGRRIAFCCAKCKAKFEADPKAFAAKLPKK